MTAPATPPPEPTAPRPGAAAHAARPALRVRRLPVLLGGVCAVAAGAGVVALLPAGDGASGPVSARPMTATPRVPLSADEVLALTADRAELGPLTDPRRLAACLTGLGYPPSTAVLGGRQVDVTGRPAVVLVLPGRGPSELVAVAVGSGCGAPDTDELARTTVRRG